MPETITYSIGDKGWDSRYSYHPDAIIGMNSRLYTFKNGNLWVHDSNEVRNNFYDEQYTSKITGVLNMDPYSRKHFKTISLDSNDSWSCGITTDLGDGFIDSTWFEEKEGIFYAHIRGKTSDLNLRSAQGIGSSSGFSLDSGAIYTIDYSFNIGSIVSVGDLLYELIGGNIVLIGKITQVDTKSLKVDTSDGTVPTGAYTLYLKNVVAESNGVKGYYLEFELENNSTSLVEIFSVSSSIFKSYP